MIRLVTNGRALLWLVALILISTVPCSAKNLKSFGADEHGSGCFIDLDSVVWEDSNTVRFWELSILTEDYQKELQRIAKTSSEPMPKSFLYLFYITRNRRQKVTQSVSYDAAGRFLSGGGLNFGWMDVYPFSKQEEYWSYFFSPSKEG